MAVSHPLRADTLSTMVALLSVTGMRRCEASALDLDDVNWIEGLLVVRDSNLGQVARADAPRLEVAARCRRQI